MAEKRLSQMINVEDFYGISAYKQGELCGMILGSKEQFYDGVMFNIKEFCVKNGMEVRELALRFLRNFK